MVTLKSINEFTSNKDIAVIGASSDKKKFGYIILKNLNKKNFKVYPVNPGAKEIDGIACYPDVLSLPVNVKAAVFITRPEITEKITRQICESKTIEHLWFQQGAEHNSAIEIAIINGKNVIYGECILMHTGHLGFPHNIHRFFKKLFGKYPK
jgi:predicted CoA-binding protein